MSEADHFERKIFLIRHAQREDQQISDSDFTPLNPKNSKKVHEPNCSITRKGEYQSYLTGRAIDQDYLNEDEEDNSELEPVLVLASPYKRCVQTAINICKGLEVGGRKIYKNTIFISFQAQEYLNQKNKMTREELLTELMIFKKKFSIPYELRLAPFEESPPDQSNFIPHEVDLNAEQIQTWQLNHPAYIEDAPKSYIRTRRLLKKLKSSSLRIDEYHPETIILVSHYVTILNSLLQYARVMEANSPIHYCSMSLIKLKRVKYPHLIKFDKDSEAQKNQMFEHFIPKKQSKLFNQQLYVKTLIDKDKERDFDVSLHPLYPKNEQKDSIELLTEVLQAEDSDLKNPNLHHPSNKEGITEDSGDWYLDKMVLVNEAGHTDDADFIGQIGKF